MRRFTRNRAGLIAVFVFAALFLAAVLAPVVAHHDPLEQNIINRLSPPAWFSDGLEAHPFGTDQVGRDLFSRVLYGGRITLLIALLGAGVAGSIGVTLGLLAGYYGGRLADLLMRVADIQHAFPFLILAIAVVAVLGSTLPTLIVVLGVWGWASFARVVRAEVLIIREQDYIAAARALGASDARILLRHILPSTFPIIIIMGTITLVQMIVGETALSFLGMGVQPPHPSWGNIIADGREHLETAWWLSTMPGFAILLMILSINTFGDALRDALDPHALD